MSRGRLGGFKSRSKWGIKMKVWNRIKTALVRVGSDEEGVTAIEYALIAALVAVALVTGLQSLEGGIAGTFTKVTTALGGA